jgi:rod shape-determining protein MreC
MKNSFPRTLQTIVIIITIGGLIALALGGYFNPVSSWFQRLVVDGQSWFSNRYLAVVDFLTVPRDLVTTRQRNIELEAEVAQLQTQLIELRQKVLQTEILSALVDFARTNPEYSYTGATVIGRDPSPFYRYVIINVGSNDNILPGMPVVTEKGLVGRVDAVIAEAARVQLITDSDSEVNITLPASNTEAILVGSTSGDLFLDMIPQDAAIQTGDVVLTSGLGGGYPANLIIGQVVSLRNLDYELFQQATIQPSVDFSNLQFVLIIVDFQPVDISPLIP